MIQNKIRACAAWLIILLAACSGEKTDHIDDPGKRNEKWAWVEDPKTGEGRWIALAEGGDRPEGKYTLFYSNGRIRQKGIFRNQKREDTTWHFDTAEKPMLKAVYHNDSLLLKIYLQPVCRLYFPTCELLSVIENTNNQLNGREIVYYQNGTKRAEGHYHNGLRHGRFFGWNESGKLISETSYINDTLNGTCRSWYDNGQMETETSFSRGTMNGKKTDWYENGQVKSVFFVLNDLPEGEACTWYENGRKEMEMVFVNGRKNGPFKTWHSNGKLHEQGTLVNDEATDDYREWDENGRPVE